MQKISPAKKIFFFSIVFMVSILLAVICGEFYVRMFSKTGYITLEMLRDRSLQYEPTLFARHALKQEEHLVDGWDGGEWQINQKGYRGRNFPIEKSNTTIRVMIYGGSAAFNLGAPKGQDWPHQVEAILRKKGYSTIEVINAGIPGHASFDSFGRLYTEGHWFKPDYVLLYNGWNDIKYFRSNESLLRHHRPYTGEKDPRLNYQNDIDKFLCEVSQSYIRIRKRYFIWKLNAGTEGVKPRGKYSSKLSPMALAQFKLNVELFVDAARNIGATPILMTQARLVTSDITESQKERIRYEFQLLTHDALVTAFESMDKIIHQVSIKKGSYLIDAARQLTGKDEIFRDHVHLTLKGAKELAELTADVMISILETKKFNCLDSLTIKMPSNSIPYNN